MHTTFIPGITLCAQFYREAVRPILNAHFPNLKHAAALIGDGSEVLGFDDSTSTDHGWGPRLLLFVEPEALPAAEPIRQALAQLLPKTFRGYPTNFSPPDPTDGGTQVLQALSSGPVNHRRIGSVFPNNACVPSPPVRSIMTKLGWNRRAHALHITPMMCGYTSLPRDGRASDRRSISWGVPGW